MLLSFMQYPELPKGTVGVGSTHHFALIVDTRRGAGGVARLPAPPRRRVHRRLRPRCIPLDLPPRSRRAHRRDRHARAGLPRRRRRGRVATATAPPAPSGGYRRVPAAAARRPAVDPCRPTRSRAPSSRRWRSVIVPTVLVSDIGIDVRNRRQRVRPQPVLAHQQVADGHALGFPRAAQHHVGDGRLPLSHLPLELGPSQPNPVRLRKRPHVLRGRCCRSCSP